VNGFAIVVVWLGMNQPKDMQCPMFDDKDIRCKNIMSKQEYRQDGYCFRCADALWAWQQNNTPIIFNTEM
jgi:hypothetical protein